MKVPLKTAWSEIYSPGLWLARYLQRQPGLWITPRDPTLSYYLYDHLGTIYWITRLVTAVLPPIPYVSCFPLLLLSISPHSRCCPPLFLLLIIIYWSVFSVLVFSSFPYRKILLLSYPTISLDRGVFILRPPQRRLRQQHLAPHPSSSSLTDLTTRSQPPDPTRPSRRSRCR